MKKLLSILGAIGLTATSTTSLISCEKPNNNENGGNKPEPTPKPQQPPENSNWKLITDIENEFKIKNNNKYYFTIWQHNNKKRWEIKEFKNGFDINLIKNNPFKGLYRWNGNGEPTTPTINKDTGEITDWNEKIES